MKEIRLQDIEGFRIGSAENSEAGTGCTVIICEQGAPCSVDVRGGGPARLESELINPVAVCVCVFFFFFFCCCVFVFF